MLAYKSKGRSTIRAVITRANGKVENLGVIAGGNVWQRMLRHVSHWLTSLHAK